MSSTRLSATFRAPALSNILSSCRHRSFHCSSRSHSSILFALGALSNSRETQHFNKLSRLPRIEHSPPLKLIKTSEVDPFPLPTPPKPAPRSNAWQSISPDSALRIWDDKALKIGRVLLADQARQTHRLQRALARAKRRQTKQDALLKRDKLAWQQERAKLQQDMRAAGMWILLSIATATALATWRFFPTTNSQVDSGELGMKIASRAAASMPLPAAVSSEPAVPLIPSLPAAAPSAVPMAKANQEPAPAVVSDHDSSSSWWRGFLWKQ